MLVRNWLLHENTTLTKEHIKTITRRSSTKSCTDKKTGRKLMASDLHLFWWRGRESNP